MKALVTFFLNSFETNTVKITKDELFLKCIFHKHKFNKVI